MNASREQSAIRILSGEARGLGPGVLRGILWIAERFYIVGIRFRNWLFDAGIKKQHKLAPCVISVGNITTGGTGKTPAVQWIARQLLAAGHRPACLLRGYTHGGETASDEASLLARSLQIPVGVNPDRVAESMRLLKEHPEIDVILLDDGFQHRRVQRDLNIVLIDATNPFGFDHVLPRGLLREPLSGLRRADLIVLTRFDQADKRAIEHVCDIIRVHNFDARTLRSQHRITRFVCDGQAIDSIQGKPIFTLCGIGNPKGFHQQLIKLGAIDAGREFLDDHHAYVPEEIRQLASKAKAGGASMIMTTEKDWMKIERLKLEALAVPICVAEMEFEFAFRDGDVLRNRLLELMQGSKQAESSSVSSG